MLAILIPPWAVALYKIVFWISESKIASLSTNTQRRLCLYVSYYTPVKFIQNLKTKYDCAMISPSKQDVSTALKNLPLGLFGNPFFPSLLEHKKIFQWNAISHCILKEIK